MTDAKGIQGKKRISFAAVISMAAGALIIFSGLIAWSQVTITTSNSIFDLRGTGWWSGLTGQGEEEGRETEVAMIWLPSVAVVTGLTSGVIVLLAGTMMYLKPQRKRIWGIMVLIFSILALLSLGNFFVFGVGLGVIGGVLSIVNKQIR